MTAQKKTLIVLIVLFVVMVAVLVFGMVAQKDSASGDPAQSNVARNLNDLLGRFATPVPLDNAKCGSQSVALPRESDWEASWDSGPKFSLTGAKPKCDIRLNPKRGKDFGRAELKVRGPAKLYFKAKLEEKRYPRTDTLKKSNYFDPATVAGLHVTAEWIAGDTADGWPAYILISPGDSGAITATEDGGILRLECVGCNDNRSVQLRMK